ncbi:hypothetical protein HQ587_07850 [bacterium]|nr:hypothetical protein [bacterium]
MPEKVVSRSPGSLLVKIIIGVLIIVLLLAIVTPKKQWKNQAAEEAVCRERMENIYFASKFYHRIARKFTSNLDSLLAFAVQESIDVHPPGFKMDRLTREESGLDSFQVDYFDPYQLFSHYEKAIEFEYPTSERDSVVLRIVPKEQFLYAPVTIYTFATTPRSPAYRSNEIANPTLFAVQLLDKRNPVSEFVRSRLSPTNQNELGAYGEQLGSSIDTLPPSETFQQSLIDDLNRLIEGENIYEEKRFRKVELSGEIKKLIGQTPSSDELIRLNRMLLDEAFDGGLVKAYFYIAVETDDRGDQGVFTMVGAQSQLRGTHILGEKTRVPAWKHIFYLDMDNLNEGPTTGLAYKSFVNVKLFQEAEMSAVMHEEPAETSLYSSTQLSSMVIYRMLKESDGKATRTLLGEKTFEAVEDSLINTQNETFLAPYADSLHQEGWDELAAAVYDTVLDEAAFDDAQVSRWEMIREASYAFMNRMKEDSTLGAVRDSIVDARKDVLTADNFQAQLEKARTEKSLSVVEVGFTLTTADSIEYYSDPEYIKKRLFRAREDKITKAKLADPEVADLLKHFSYIGEYKVTKIDSTGLTIVCPIEGEFHKPDQSLLDRIFKVKGAFNHGRVEQSDLSWSEKR